jgi:hypothetical protein
MSVFYGFLTPPASMWWHKAEGKQMGNILALMASAVLCCGISLRREEKETRIHEGSGMVGW